MQFGGQTLPQIIDDIANRIVELYRRLPFACFDSSYSTSQNGGKITRARVWCIYKMYPFANKIYNLQNVEHFAAIAFQ